MQCICTNVFTKEIESKKEPGKKNKVQFFSLASNGYQYPYYFSLPVSEKYPEIQMYGLYDVEFGFGYYLKEEPDETGELHKVPRPSWRVTGIKVAENVKAKS